MNETNGYINPGTKSILDDLTNTLLYEGYSIFPYHRSAVKNQKPIPFGVVYPKIYNVYDPNIIAEMQSQSVVTGNKNLSFNIAIRFLHLIKSVEEGWQTIERKVDAGNLNVIDLLKTNKEIPFHFDATGKEDNSALPIRGDIIIKAEAIKNIERAFRVTVVIINTSIIHDVKIISRDEALRQSFLSTHIILTAADGEFISSQNPPENFREAIEANKNIGTWQIMMDEENTTILSSPIIVYDYPKIHPKSKTALFDSTEIEEALMLHFAVMSDDEKNRIANSDEKLRAMLNKVSEITPEELINLHGGMFEESKK